MPSKQADLLGAGFMDHPSIFAGTVDVASNYAFQRLFSTQVKRRRKYSLRLSAAAHWQRSERRANVTGAFIMKNPENEFDIYTEFRDFSKFWTSPSKVWRAATTMASLGAALAKDGFVYKSLAKPVLAICAEQEPQSSNRVSLGSQIDKFGIPLISLQWGISELTWTTVVEFAQLIKAEMSRLSLGNVVLRRELEDVATERPDLFYDIGHHMGGTAIGNLEATSIVSPELRVWAISNLWICSGSVFVTSSHSNPTLTILALADRLALCLAALHSKA